MSEKQADQIDWGKYRVMIATPCMDGKYESRYVKSFKDTIVMALSAGLRLEWMQLPYHSEIAGARAKIFGAFLRSDATHLMMIDSDMGWQANDIFRLIHADRDLIGAAGPKKIYSPTSPCGLEFAVSNVGVDGKNLPLLREAGIGAVEVTEVGMAFMLMSRNCAEKMVAAYPELQFRANGFTEYALYEPMIVENGWRLAEDYAFCRRWRNIGGKVNLLPDIRIAHVGCHTWEGALEQACGSTYSEMPIGAYHVQKA